MRIAAAVVALILVSVALMICIGPDAKTTITDPDDIASDNHTIMIEGPGSVSVQSYDGTNVVYRAQTVSNSSFIGWYQGIDLIQSGTDLTVDVTAEGVSTYTATFSSTTGLKVIGYDFTYPDYPTPTVSASGRMGVIVSDTVYESSVDAPDVPRRYTLAEPYPDTLATMGGTAVQSAVTYLTEITEGMNDLACADVILRFVQQCIDYETDAVQYGTDEFWSTPYETLYTQAGDCEDTAVLFCALASAMGYDTALVVFDTHMGAAISVDGVTGGHEVISGTVTYSYVETALDDTYSPIGAMSESLDLTSATVVPIIGDP